MNINGGNSENNGKLFMVVVVEVHRGGSDSVNKDGSKGG